MAQRKVRALARPKTPNGIAGMDYFTAMTNAAKPARRGKPVADSGEDKKNARRFHIAENEIAQYRTLHKEGDAFPSPHREGRYHYIIEALKGLGLDERHDWTAFYEKVKQLMNDPATKDDQGLTLWDRSIAPDEPDDREGRLLANVQVIQRLGGMTPYGLRIHQIAQRVLGRRGACIDLEVWGDKLFIRLNLQPRDDSSCNRRRPDLPPVRQLVRVLFRGVAGPQDWRDRSVSAILKFMVGNAI